MQRIYIPNTDFQNKLTIVDKELYHQITRVMRARVWQGYAFFDGKALKDYIYEIVDINKSECSFNLTHTKEKDSEIQVGMNLYQGLPNKFSKLETIVQKCSEVGYKKIIFFQALNSQKLVVSENKKERLHKIAIEAIEQCGGNIIPEIHFEASFPWEFKWELYACHTQWYKSQSLVDIEFWDEVNIVVGPEWGLHNDELETLEQLWAHRIFFWERIFRSETVAPLVWFYIAQKKES